MNPFVQTLLAYSNEPSDEEKILIIGVCIFAFVGLIMTIAKFARKKEVFGEQNADEETVVENAKVLEKMSEKDALLKVTVYRIVFESSDGERVSLAVKDENMYQTIVKDDVGTLRYQGKTLVSFTRQ